jgi:hypothetical protein
VREGHEGKAPQPARESPKRTVVAEPLERFAGPVAPERFAVLQALLAYLLAACGDEKDAEIPADELLERFPSIPPEELEELSPERRAVFVMYELNGHAMSEVAETLGTPLFTAYSRLRIARAHVAGWVSFCFSPRSNRRHSMQPALPSRFQPRARVRSSTGFVRVAEAGGLIGYGVAKVLDGELGVQGWLSRSRYRK